MRDRALRRLLRTIEPKDSDRELVLTPRPNVRFRPENLLIMPEEPLIEEARKALRQR